MADKTKREIAEKAKQLGKQFEAIIAMGELISNFDQFERATAEAELSMKSTLEQKESQELEVARITQSISDLQGQEAQDKAIAGQLLKQAQTDADQLARKAQANASKILADAGEEAKDFVEAEKQKISKLTEKAVSLSEDVEDLEAQAADRQKTLNDVENRIAEHKKHAIQSISQM